MTPSIHAFKSIQQAYLVQMSWYYPRLKLFVTRHALKLIECFFNKAHRSPTSALQCLSGITPRGLFYPPRSKERFEKTKVFTSLSMDKVHLSPGRLSTYGPDLREDFECLQPTTLHSCFHQGRVSLFIGITSIQFQFSWFLCKSEKKGKAPNQWTVWTTRLYGTHCSITNW